MRWSVVLVAVATLILGGCTLNRIPTAMLTVPTEYALDTGDVVRVTVYGDTTITNTYTVTDKGTINIPLAGPIQARGGTISTTEQMITARLADGYMISPKVSVEITTYRPFFIEGAVTNSGQFPYVWGMTARAAVATAGGFKDFADRTHVTLFRKTAKSTIKFSIPLDTPIRPGDTIVAEDRWF
jgi:polysaccharide export outer membrane protein